MSQCAICSRQLWEHDEGDLGKCLKEASKRLTEETIGDLFEELQDK